MLIIIIHIFRTSVMQLRTASCILRLAILAEGHYRLCPTSSSILCQLRLLEVPHALPTAPSLFFFFFQAEDGIRDVAVTGVQTCALPISGSSATDQSPVLQLAVVRMRDAVDTD